MKYKLSEVAYYSKEKIKTDELSPENYLSTENMLPEFGGITTASSLPTISTVTKYQPGDILLSNIRPYFKKLYYSISEGGCSNDVLCLCAKDNINKAFLYYSLKNDDFFKYVMATAKGTKMPRGDKSAIMDYELEVPDLETQQKIVRILSALDQKIELNNQQNEKLMETALSFYRDLLNKQDKDWGLGYVDDGKMTKITKSGISEYFGTKKYVATADVSGTNIIHFEKVKYNEKPSRANMTPKEDTVWFAKMEGSVKNILVADFSTDLIGDYIFSTGFMGIECLNDFTYFMWCYINDEKFFDIKNSLSTGTLMAGISNSTIKNAKYLIPPQNLLIDFNTKVKPMFEKIHNNSLQNETLAKMRDSLLPKLMSGEINLDEVTINE